MKYLSIGFIILFQLFCYKVDAESDLVEKLSIKCNKGDNKACNKIIEIAMGSKYHRWDREAAVEKISDQAVLKDIAFNAQEYDARTAALKKITDQTLLVEITLSNKDIYFRSEAAKRVTDQTVLKGLVQNKKEKLEIRIAAMWNLTDTSLLIDVALHNTYSSLRIAAAKHITDQVVLNNIALNDQEEEVRNVAISKISDQSALRDMAIKYYNSTSAIVALNKMQNIDSLLLKIILQKGPTDLMKCKLFDFEPVLVVNKIQIGADSRKSGMQYEQLKWVILIDYSVIITKDYKIYFSPTYQAQRGAIKEEFAAGSDSKANYGTIDIKEVCDALLKYLSDNDILLILHHSAFDDLRMACLRRVTDQSLLNDIALNDREENVRIAARDRLQKLKGITK